MGWLHRVALAGGIAAGAYLAVSAGMAAGLTRVVRVRSGDDPSSVGLDFSEAAFMSRDGAASLTGWLIPPGGFFPTGGEGWSNEVGAGGQGGRFPADGEGWSNEVGAGGQGGRFPADGGGWSNEVGAGGQGGFFPAGARWIVMVHGFGTNRTNPAASALGLVRDLACRGFGILMFDLRACGESGGERSSVGYFERLDLLGALDFLVSMGVDRTRIGVHGVSLGAAVALMACANPGTAAAVVADSSFADLSFRMREGMTGGRRFLGLFMPGMLLAARYLFGLDVKEVSPARDIASSDTPALIVHGEDDTMVPVRHARILGRAVGADPDSPTGRSGVWIVPGAGHVQGYRMRRTEYVDRVAGFFDRHLASF